MTCAHCGTEIADKALVCYRCGRATSEPRVRPGQAPARRSIIPAAAALAVVVVGALFMSQAAVGQAPPFVRWVVGGLAGFALVSIWWFWRRR